MNGGCRRCDTKTAAAPEKRDERGRGDGDSVRYAARQQLRDPDHHRRHRRHTRGRGGSGVKRYRPRRKCNMRSYAAAATWRDTLGSPLRYAGGGNTVLFRHLVRPSTPPSLPPSLHAYSCVSFVPRSTTSRTSGLLPSLTLLPPLPTMTSSRFRCARTWRSRCTWAVRSAAQIQRRSREKRRKRWKMGR